MSLVIDAIELLVNRVSTEKINRLYRELMEAKGDEKVLATMLKKLFAELPKEQIPEFMAELYMQRYYSKECGPSGLSGAH